LTLQVTSLANAQKALKLGDFGLAVEVNGFLHDIVGCDLYHAPEIFTTKGLVHLTLLPSLSPDSNNNQNVG
jgi:hypothetical protein